MREIALSPTRLPNGTEVPNEPVRVYDTSGPWGDPDFHGDPAPGLPRSAPAWIRERGDVEETPGRRLQPIDDGYLSESAPRRRPRPRAGAIRSGISTAGAGRSSGPSRAAG